MSNESISYPELVSRLAKPGESIVSTLTPHQAHLLHMILGICGEAGELLDTVKKHVIYNQPLDEANVEEELGDLEFYLEGFRESLKISRERVIIANQAKLLKRYSSLSYSDEAAKTRADKQ